MKKSLHQRKRKTINDRGHRPRSGRQHKAWRGASEASGTPGTRTTKTQEARGAGDRLKEPKVSARDEFIEFLQANGIGVRLAIGLRSAARSAGSSSDVIGSPGLTPRALCCRALRALVERSCRDLVDGHCMMCLVLLFGQSRDFCRENKHLLIFSVSSVVN